MEGRQDIIEALHEEETPEDFEDVDMLDVEEGEIEEQNPCVISNEGEIEEHNPCVISNEGEIEEQNPSVILNEGVFSGDINMANQESRNRNRRRSVKKKKKKNNKRTGSVSNVMDINRFVLDTCRRLKEKKPYLVWNAVGCLGVSALSDLVKEVDAIQLCGGQMTADGKRHRTGGGILWNILKVREPKAYKEIMTRGKDFEKQFRQQNVRHRPGQKREATSQDDTSESCETITNQVSGSSPVQNEPQQPDIQRSSVQNRIRVPITYDDILGEDPKDESPPLRLK